MQIANIYQKKSCGDFFFWVDDVFNEFFCREMFFNALFFFKLFNKMNKSLPAAANILAIEE